MPFFFDCEACGERCEETFPGQRRCEKCPAAHSLDINSLPKPLKRKIACGDKLYRAYVADFGEDQIIVREYEVQSVGVFFRVAPLPVAPPLASGRSERLRWEDFPEFSTTPEAAVDRLIGLCTLRLNRANEAAQTARSDLSHVLNLKTDGKISTTKFNRSIDT